LQSDEQLRSNELGPCPNACIGDSAASEAMSGVPPPFNPTVMSRREARPVVRSPKQLRQHRVLEEIGWTGAIDEFNAAARLKEQSVPEPILITTNGTILAGFGRWRSALFDDRHEINCIEYPLGDDEALQFIIRHHQTQRGWNAFVRIRLALTLEPHFQHRALANMRAGGKYKGLASLPDVQRIDVRQEIAGVAGVGARNVSNVKAVIETAHPRMIEALGNGTLTINRAIQFCNLPRAEQLEQFIRYSEETHHEQGDPSDYRSAQRGKHQPRRYHRSRGFKAPGGATARNRYSTSR
jgi:hypothetical protein